MHVIGQPLVLKDGTQVPLSPGIRCGNLVFLSGQLGLTPEMTLAGDDVVVQTQQALANIARLLDEAGSSMSHVVKATVWLTDKADFPAFNKAYAAAFGGCFPARSTVVSDLLIPGARVEIEVVACVPEN
ncbi:MULTISPECIES: RidA family protein [Kordiimonadales]|uniref:RidA family protein n=1 Tax=Gimibacter soli TaxID=3024400 RepID=A0AAE9XUW0_9PROT|nr:MULTISPECIES: RidA family protein [Kordiimonadales]WCL55581.1 RidA family protein [Gimibacter soli]